MCIRARGGPSATLAGVAQAAAASAGDLAQLRAAIAGFEGSGLRDTATGPVLFEGAPGAALLVIGPPPSAEDDRSGRPLTGAPGAFLDAMLASIGLSREGLLLAPLIPWRPPGDRPPSPVELATCLPFLHRLIVLCRPRLALLLGPLTARTLLGGSRKPPRGRFTAASVPGRDTPLMCLSIASPAQLRADLVRHGQVEAGGVWLPGHGTHVGVGDMVQARRNAWHLTGYQHNAYVPINRETYRVLATQQQDGGLVVARVIGRDPHTREELRAAPIRLPGQYVAEHIALAYASTVHAAEGRTVDTGHYVTGPTADLHSLYPAMTRGRDGNWVYAITRTLPRDAETGETHDLHPSTPRAVLAGILDAADTDAAAERDLAARAYAEHAAETAASVMRHVDRLAAEIAEHTAHRVAGVLDRLATQGVLRPEDRVALVADEHYSSLLARLRTVELAGYDLDAVLTDAVGQRDFHQVRPVADVLHAPIPQMLPAQPRLAAFTDPPPRAPSPVRCPPRGPSLASSVD